MTRRASGNGYTRRAAADSHNFDAEAMPAVRFGPGPVAGQAGRATLCLARRGRHGWLKHEDTAMADFPRTQIERLSVSRMIIGTNWFLGWSHTSKANDDMIKSTQTRQSLSEILKVFFRAGVDTVMGTRPDAPQLSAAIEDAEQATGRKCITIATPMLDISGSPEVCDRNARTLDQQVAIGADICMPHQGTTDALVNRRTRRIDDMDKFCRMIRDRGMIPGLSTHMPETPIYADETDLDVASYIQIYNAAGFLMQIEVDWVHRMIWNCAKPVMTIKPMAAGRLIPLVGMAFNWSTIREQDMVTVGAYTPDEARELIDISLAILQRRGSTVPLQRTRSKQSIERPTSPASPANPAVPTGSV